MILHSNIIGEGAPFVILHGFLGMGDNWKTLGNRFSVLGYQVHLIDQRNHGRSFHSNEFSYELMSQDLDKYFENNDIENAVVLGHSMGGKTAMQFSVDNPTSVNKLVVADIAPKFYPLHHQDILKALSSLDFDLLKSRGEANEVLNEYIKHYDTRQFLLKNLYWVDKGKLGLRINLPALIENIDEVGKTLTQEELFEGETLFIKGGQSGYVQNLDELVIEKHFPKSRIDTISDAGHWLHAENPDEFYRIVKDFL